MQAPPSNNTINNNSRGSSNQVQLLEYRGAQLAAFNVEGRGPLICLPQAFELFLKHFVGGLHTVYTKLKRLEIQPVVCNVEQVRILRGLGAIQPGVNRCKLIAPREFDILYADCTTSSARPGRPSKRTAMPLYLQERINIPSSGESLFSPKMPRFELGLPPNLDSGRGLSLLQLLSLPPESVLEWFRLSWVGEKPHRNDQNGITPSTSFRSNGGNPLPSQYFECRKVLEKNSQHLNESRLNVLKVGGFLNGSSIPRPEDLLTNFPSLIPSTDEGTLSHLTAQNPWWKQLISALETLQPPPVHPAAITGVEQEEVLSEVNSPLELTVSCKTSSAPTVPSTSEMVPQREGKAATAPMMVDPCDSQLESYLGGISCFLKLIREREVQQSSQ
ncbi:dachshund [Echinococcus multilocularis]|uniref:Dachshund n=1 Tax=Echinococcus multilocularis TaxID=6211 RepID=A0A068Y4P7_ECHMU|nr:dachshund [Echinococcus multilocularis]